MKRQKKGLALLAIILVTIIGIGYAAVNKELTITGKATALATDVDVRFDKTTEPTTGKSEGTNEITVTASYSADNEITADFSVAKLKKIGDLGFATYKIKNYGETSALVTFETTAPTSDNYAVQVSFGENSSAIIEPNGTADVTVLVALEKPFIDEATATAEYNFTVKLNAEAYDETSNS